MGMAIREDGEYEMSTRPVVFTKYQPEERKY